MTPCRRQKTDPHLHRASHDRDRRQTLTFTGHHMTPCRRQKTDPHLHRASHDRDRRQTLTFTGNHVTPCRRQKPDPHLHRAPPPKATWLLVARGNHPFGQPVADGVDPLQQALSELDVGLESLVQQVAHDVGLAARRNVQYWDAHLCEGFLQDDVQHQAIGNFRPARQGPGVPLS